MTAVTTVECWLRHRKGASFWAVSQPITMGCTVVVCAVFACTIANPGLLLGAVENIELCRRPFFGCRCSIVVVVSLASHTGVNPQSVPRHLLQHPRLTTEWGTWGCGGPQDGRQVGDTVVVDKPGCACVGRACLYCTVEKSPPPKLSALRFGFVHKIGPGALQYAELGGYRRHLPTTEHFHTLYPYYDSEYQDGSTIVYGRWMDGVMQRYRHSCVPWPCWPLFPTCAAVSILPSFFLLSAFDSQIGTTPPTRDRESSANPWHDGCFWFCPRTKNPDWLSVRTAPRHWECLTT